MVLATTSSPQTAGSGEVITSRSIWPWASSSRSIGTCAIASRVAGTPSTSASRAPIRAAAAGGMTWWAAPLCRMARRNSPSARGMDRRTPIDIAPADSPKTVRRSGSPPKAAMLSRTQVRAAT
jgi:hypothetical protein